MARRALDAFARLDAGERDGFFEFLRSELGADPAALDAAIEGYRAAPDPQTRRRRSRPQPSRGARSSCA